MQDCIFCKITKKEIPADLIFEDENIISFLDLRPVNKGHALIVSKNHSENMLEAADQDLQLLIVSAKKIAPAILKVTGATGFNLHVNTHPDAGQVVMHTHFHIIPRYANDGLKMWPHTESEPKTRAQMAEEIKKLLV